MTRTSLARHIPTDADPAEQTARTRHLLRQLADRFGVVPIDLRRVDSIAEREVICRVAERQGVLPVATPKHAGRAFQAGKPMEN